MMVQSYFIHDRAAVEEFSDSSFPMDFENRFIRNDNLYLDFSLTALPENQDILATSIKLTSRDQFVRDVSVLGSYDGMYWEPVTRYTIFNVSDSQRLEIPLSPAQRYRWYRFRIPFAEDPVSIDSVELNYNSSVWRFSDFIQGLAVPFSVEEDGNTTVVTLQGVRNLPLDSITLGTDSMFKRHVSAGRAQKALFNLMFEDASYQDLVLPMDGYASNSDELELIIFNNDDTPIQINSINYLIVGTWKCEHGIVYTYTEDGIFIEEINNHDFHPDSIIKGTYLIEGNNLIITVPRVPRTGDTEVSERTTVHEIRRISRNRLIFRSSDGQPDTVMRRVEWR